MFIQNNYFSSSDIILHNFLFFSPHRQCVWLPFDHTVCTREDHGPTFCGKMYQSGGKKRYFLLDTNKMKIKWILFSCDRKHFFVLKVWTSMDFTE